MAQCICGPTTPWGDAVDERARRAVAPANTDVVIYPFGACQAVIVAARFPNFNSNAPGKPCLKPDARNTSSRRKSVVMKRRASLIHTTLLCNPQRVLSSQVQVLCGQYETFNSTSGNFTCNIHACRNSVGCVYSHSHSQHQCVESRRHWRPMPLGKNMRTFSLLIHARQLLTGRF